jgi:hypothetical protein
MTSTAVGLGMGTPGAADEAALDCDCTTAAAGSTVISKGIMKFIGLSFRFSLSRSIYYKEYVRALKDAKKIILQRSS